MKLKLDWKVILTRAWSVRFTALAIVLSGIEAGLSMINPDAFGIPQGTFAVASAVASAAAFWARLVAQKGIS